ncbi:MAG: lytic transglycosylase domain-containing protein [Clostridia bacterium]|nr:lytic transglycosylase domain-containing protein [Clostridia bacterium]
MNNRKRAVIIILIVLGAMLVSLTANLIISAVQKNAHPVRYKSYVEVYASQYNVPEYVVYAVINTESGFNASLESPTGERGLMQMSPELFALISSEQHLDEKIDVDALFDPEISIRYGVYYLRYLFNEFQSWSTAIAAYDAGESTVKEWLDNIKYSSDRKNLTSIPEKETAAYVKKVNGAISYYKTTYYRNGVSVK